MRARELRAGTARRLGVLLAVGSLLGITGCGGTQASSTPSPPAPGPQPGATTATTATTPALPGTGKPQVTIGDKNFTEQFILGQLYAKALAAQGFSVQINQNIGPTEVTLGALGGGLLDMYPEYLRTWDETIAGLHRTFHSWRAAYAAGRRYAHTQGLELLTPTPFSDTPAVLTTGAYAAANHLRSMADLRRVAAGMTFGGPVQFEQDPNGLPALEQAYGFYPESLQTLDVGGQYAALDAGTVQAAEGATTDGQLALGGYRLLADPRQVFGYGEVAPVVPAKVILAEGPAFVATIDAVSRLLTTDVMRQLNAAVDLYHQDPASVAALFLQSHGLVPAAQGR